MKPSFPLLIVASLLFVTLASCRKQVEKADETIMAAINQATGNCKPVGFAVAIRDNSGNTTWKNLFLKWYDQNGRLTNVKLDFDFFGGTQCCPEISIEYGELIYTADEIHLRDVQYNEEILRIKLDAMKRPITSWYDGHGRAGQYQFDTTYYHYDGSGRLDWIEQHRRFTPASTETAIDVWKFTYDPDGNLVLINRPGKFGGYEFRYDYTQLDHGMTSLHMLSGPTKALEYLDLIKFERRHRISEVIVYAESGFPNIIWSYGNFVVNDMGQVTTYTQLSDDSPQRYTWYTAWDCNSSQMFQTKNPTQQEFMRLSSMSLSVH
jgi:hypothetical protein